MHSFSWAQVTIAVYVMIWSVAKRSVCILCGTTVGCTVASSLWSSLSHGSHHLLYGPIRWDITLFAVWTSQVRHHIICCMDQSGETSHYLLYGPIRWHVTFAVWTNQVRHHIICCMDRSDKTKATCKDINMKQNRRWNTTLPDTIWHLKSFR